MTMTTAGKILTLRVLWLLYTPSGETSHNSTFCPHSVFVCSIWIPQQTAIISLCSFNGLVFITERDCVYCEVRNRSLNTIQVNLGFQMHYKCHRTKYKIKYNTKQIKLKHNTKQKQQKFS